MRSKYDFADEATRFFYDNAEILYKTRTQKFNPTVISSYMAEETERLSKFKSYGGIKIINQWIEMSNPDDCKNYKDVLKKYSLLREFQRNGFNIEKIVSHRNFESFSAQNIYQLIRSKADKIHTVIMANTESEVLNSNVRNTLLSLMETPDLGLKMPFPILNDIFRGLKRKSLMAVGMLSNDGKTRFMTALVAYTTLVMGERTLVLLNEMSPEELRYALITTVINTPWFQEIHGIKLNKPERELTIGLYKDSHGKYIYRKKDEWGEPTESIEEYIARVSKNSDEFKKIMQIADWVDSKTHELIIVKDMVSAYDDRTLEFEIRKAHLTQNVNYFFYDTFKPEIADIGDWASMKGTATKLAELVKDLNMFGYLSIQLSDEANYIEPEKLTSSLVANCKQIKHILYTLLLAKQIPPAKYHKYGYYSNNSDWGEPTIHNLDDNKKYYCFVVDKNRFGEKAKVVFEVDLNYNTWEEKGKLVLK